MANAETRSQLRAIWLAAVALTASGCGYEVNGNTPPSPADVVAPLIVQQPENESVPMGLSATYSVNAAGTQLQYRWTKNGADVPGATGSTYVTPATSLADSHSSFSVVVSNSAGTVTSAAATLTVTARAPSPGDLRFQQVDAASTVNGYGAAGVVPGTISGGNPQSLSSSLGTALWVGGTGPCTVTAPSAADCSWNFATIPLSGSLATLGLVAGYASDSSTNLQYDLADPNWPDIGPGLSPATANAVVTSLDLEPASQLFAVSWIQVPSNQQTSFSLFQRSVTPAELAAAAAAEGQSSRVITAASYDGGQIYFLSYGWSADPGTVYETQVSMASAAAAPAMAAALAGQGYIITATGRADAAGEVLLVGTRVQGDSMPRPFMTAQGGNVQALMQQGYAPVGVIVNTASSDQDTYLGER